MLLFERFLFCVGKVTITNQAYNGNVLRLFWSRPFDWHTYIKYLLKKLCFVKNSTGTVNFAQNAVHTYLQYFMFSVSKNGGTYENIKNP